MSSRVEDETVILNLAAGTYFSLNSVGTAVWETLQRPVTVLEVLEAVIRQFEVSVELAESDILALVSDMVGAGLVRIQGPHRQLS